ncbi:MAG: hypothetical protein JW915_25295, partial [Chitinispirillaceae bacterium]|nr:hypothetical protein [Chitinispirillaceae bacterium]
MSTNGARSSCVCNMVVEHITDTKQLFKSVQYLLKNAGRAYFLFPVKEAIREGHIGQYFIHWLPKGKLRYTIALIQRRLGISRKEHPDMSAHEYVKMKLDGIDENTHYKSYAAIRKQMSNIFTLHELETDFFLQRLSDKRLGFLSPIFEQPALRKLTNAFFRIYSFAVVKAEHLPTYQVSQTVKIPHHPTLLAWTAPSVKNAFFETHDLIHFLNISRK